MPTHLLESDTTTCAVMQKSLLPRALAYPFFIPFVKHITVTLLPLSAISLSKPATSLPIAWVAGDRQRGVQQNFYVPRFRLHFQEIPLFILARFGRTRALWSVECWFRELLGENFARWYDLKWGDDLEKPYAA